MVFKLTLEFTVGVSIEQLSPGGGLLDAMRTMRESGSTAPVSIRHNMISRGGLLDVVTREYFDWHHIACR